MLGASCRWSYNTLRREVQKVPADDPVAAHRNDNMDQKTLPDGHCDTVDRSREIRWDLQSLHVFVELKHVARFDRLQQRVGKSIGEMPAVVDLWWPSQPVHVSPPPHAARRGHFERLVHNVKAGMGRTYYHYYDCMTVAVVIIAMIVAVVIIAAPLGDPVGLLTTT